MWSFINCYPFIRPWSLIQMCVCVCVCSRNILSYWYLKSAGWTWLVTCAGLWIRCPPLQTPPCTWTDSLKRWVDTEEPQRAEKLIKQTNKQHKTDRIRNAWSQAAVFHRIPVRRQHQVPISVTLLYNINTHLSRPLSLSPSLSLSIFPCFFCSLLWDSVTYRHA